MSELIPKRITDKNGVLTTRWVKPQSAKTRTRLPAPAPVAEVSLKPRVRIGWSDLPESVQSSVETLIGSSVIESASQAGGYSPGSADRVVTANGERLFVKAVGSSLNRHSPQFHRREARIMELLPDGLPIPKLLHVHDDGDWVALVFSDVDGRHPQLSGADLHTVLDSVETISSHPLSPEALEALPSLAAEVRGVFNGWMRLSDDPFDGLDAWAVENYTMLEELSSKAAYAVAGGSLSHVDLRADNILVDGEGEAVIVDWPWAAHGAPWFDALTVLIDARVSDPSFDTESALQQHPVFASAGSDQVDAVLAGFAGYFIDSARNPPPPGIPTLRAFQRAEGEACLSWLRERLG